MTLSEFKAWFEGFTESMDGPPGIKQWERIQARVKEITGTPVTYPAYFHQYLRTVPTPYYAYPTWVGGVGMGQTSATSQVTGTTSNQISWNNAMQSAAAITDGMGGSPQFDSHAAMNALGKADAQSLAA